MGPHATCYDFELSAFLSHAYINRSRSVRGYVTTQGVSRLRGGVVRVSSALSITIRFLSRIRYRAELFHVVGNHG